MKKKITKAKLLKQEKRRLKRLFKDKVFNWKLKVIERDKNTCQKCGNKLDTRKQCHPHHIIALQSVVRQYPELLENINNGILLCFYCHKVGPSSAHQGGFEFSVWLMKYKSEQVSKLLDFIKVNKDKEVQII